MLASAEAGKPVVDSTVEVQQLQKEVQQLTLEHQVCQLHTYVFQSCATINAGCCGLSCMGRVTSDSTHIRHWLTVLQLCNKRQPCSQPYPSGLLHASCFLQEHVTKASADLAAAYAAVEATKTDAAAEAAKSQQAVAVLQQRIAAAEADAAAARAAGMQAQQEARRLTMEKDDVAAEQLNQMQQMQQQLRTVTQQMCKQNERHEKVGVGTQRLAPDWPAGVCSDHRFLCPIAVHTLGNSMYGQTVASCHVVLVGRLAAPGVMYRPVMT